MEQEQIMQDDLAAAGRGTDTVMAHLSLGEIVIPRAMQDDPQFMEMLQQVFQQYGADINEFTVGHEANKINPETGYPEFFLKKLFKRVASIALPVVGGIVGGPIGAAAGGAAGGALGGGGLKGALIGGALSGIGSGLAGQTGTLFKEGGLLSGTALGGLNESITGALSPIGTSLSNALGGALGLGGQEVASNGLQVGKLYEGSPADIAFLSNAQRGLTGGTEGGIGSILGSAGGAGGGSTFSGGNMLSAALGGYQQDEALKKQRQQLAAANQQQLGNLENLNPVDVQNDPGYQFAQQQGEQALNRSLGAQGGLFSGRALQAAADLNQGLASRFYGDAYGRQAGKVGAQNAIYGNTGINNAAITGARADNVTSSLAKALGGNQGMTLEEMRRLGLI